MSSITIITISSISETTKKIMICFGLLGLITLNIFILPIKKIEDLYIFSVGSGAIVAVPMIFTFLASHLMALLVNNTHINLPIYINGQNLQININGQNLQITFTHLIKFISLIIVFIELGIGFGINIITIPGSLPVMGGKFSVDPLVPCKVGIDAGCANLFQSRFRFQWLQGAADVMVHGISKQLSVNWGDVVNDARIIMVATTDNNTNITYKLVQDNEERIPAFSITTICNKSAHFPGLINFHNLSRTTPTPLIQAIQADSGLNGRWIAEVINLEQDNLLETTRITVNFVQISAVNTTCEGKVDIAGNLQLCRRSEGVVCLMNTHVEYVNFIEAGCDTCMTGGITNDDRAEYSSPKPVYGEYMHAALASYGGHLLIPQCSDNSVGGCLNSSETRVDIVREQFVQMFRGITASGVMARRNLLVGEGIEIPVQKLERGVTGVKLEFGYGYWITILLMSVSVIVLSIFGLIL
ncbi:18602_t:CDS:1 [Funneliformis geosporum]|uniref:17626_t:CDS:1 n=1 Tax=Funneliformis geosporum TaxID=1117311 RepID=A0A9W4WY98_9GLOM|nr:17626_t:CDS:1 [Funneliformis geosporum]CAI2188357.1 18602_t:CDS:1 [Funneliformis geosporum]